MTMYGYGEDALTLWALKEELQQILKKLGDKTAPEKCIIFYRPSFGRAGAPQFGEFDFIILADEAIYLGESKWDRSSERIVNGTLLLRDAQCQRHNTFKSYINHYFNFKHITPNTTSFASYLSTLGAPGITVIKKSNSLLAENLVTILEIIYNHYNKHTPPIKNILLYLHSNAQKLPDGAQDINNPPIFIFNSIIKIDYSGQLTQKTGNFIII